MSKAVGSAKVSPPPDPQGALESDDMNCSFLKQGVWIFVPAQQSLTGVFPNTEAGEQGISYAFLSEVAPPADESLEKGQLWAIRVLLTVSRVGAPMITTPLTPPCPSGFHLNATETPGSQINKQIHILNKKALALTPFCLGCRREF